MMYSRNLAAAAFFVEAAPIAHECEPWPDFEPTPKSGSGINTASLPSAFLIPGAAQCPTHASATRFFVKAESSADGSEYFFHDAQVVRAFAAAFVSIDPTALPFLPTSCVPEEFTIGVNAYPAQPPPIP